MYKQPNRPIEQKDEKSVAAAFDEWLDAQEQETKELVRLHMYNIHAAFAPFRVGVGENAIKLLLTAVYLAVHERTGEVA